MRKKNHDFEFLLGYFYDIISGYSFEIARYPSLVMRRASYISSIQFLLSLLANQYLWLTPAAYEFYIDCERL